MDPGVSTFCARRKPGRDPAPGNANLLIGVASKFDDANQEIGVPRGIICPGTVDVDWRGTSIRTSIWKIPVEGPVRVRRLNLDGDLQSDLSVHGGPDKAIYVYPSEHYVYWRLEMPDTELPWGSFGENLTTQGLLEEKVNIGDHLMIGSAEFVVTQPRMPCFKLGIRFGRPDMVKRFLRSSLTGFYLSVLREGEVAAGNSIEHVAVEKQSVTVSDIVSLYSADAGNQELLRQVSELSELPEGWRDYFRKRLWEPDA